jgi:acyl-CoA oxidase
VPSPDGSGALDDHGVHAFVVPLREESGALWPGVEIHDCGYKVGGCGCHERNEHEEAGRAGLACVAWAHKPVAQDLEGALIFAPALPPRQVGLNGVDNGAIRFTSVRIPRENLLDRFATGGKGRGHARAGAAQHTGSIQAERHGASFPTVSPALAVDRSGRYSSPMTSPTKRFAATIGELTGGRVGLTCASGAPSVLWPHINCMPPGSCPHEVHCRGLNTTPLRCPLSLQWAC